MTVMSSTIFAVCGSRSLTHVPDCPCCANPKTERATGVVQKFAFTNPHGALHIAIKNAQGEAKVWQLTTGSANVLTNAGVTATGPNRVKSGDEITVTFNPALNGATIGFLRSIVLPDKKEVEFVPN